MHRIAKVAILSITVCAVASFLGCGGGGQPPTPPIGTMAISHEPTGGAEGFFFLPPLAPDPNSTDPFDPDLAPTLRVEVLLLDQGGNPVGDAVATFTDTSSTNASETIRVNPPDEYYIVNFHTDAYSLLDGRTYRIFVLRASDDAEYGFADVQVFSNMKQAKSLVDDSTFPLKDGRTLPVKFRIEQGAQPKPLLKGIAFTTNRDGDFEVYVMSTDGSNPINVTNCPGAYDSQPRWSPDGEKLAFVSGRDGNAEIYAMDARRGSVPMRVTYTPANEYSPDWSPDGNKIAFSCDSDGNGKPAIWTMNVDGSDRRRLTSEGASQDQDPRWSPDASRIVFWGGEPWPGNWEIFLVNPDGSNLVQLTHNHPWDDRHPAWSPDGQRIAFATEQFGGYVSPRNVDVGLMDADGTNWHRLTNDPGIDWDPDWSPDGSHIAFRSSRDGNQEIYVMNTDGSGQVNLTNSPASNEYDPAWSPRG